MRRRAARCPRPSSTRASCAESLQRAERPVHRLRPEGLRPTSRATLTPRASPVTAPSSLRQIDGDPVEPDRRTRRPRLAVSGWRSLRPPFADRAQDRICVPGRRPPRPRGPPRHRGEAGNASCRTMLSNRRADSPRPLEPDGHVAELDRTEPRTRRAVRDDNARAPPPRAPPAPRTNGPKASAPATSSRSTKPRDDERADPQSPHAARAYRARSLPATSRPSHAPKNARRTGAEHHPPQTRHKKEKGPEPAQSRNGSEPFWE